MSAIRVLRSTAAMLGGRSQFLNGAQARGFAKATRTAAKDFGPTKGIVDNTENKYIPPTPPTPTTPNGSNSPPPPPPEKKGLKAKLVDMWKNYGLLFIGTYGTVYISTWAGFFFLIDGNYMNIDSMGISYDGAIEQFRIMVESLTGNTSVPAYVKENPTVGKLILSMGLTDMLEPIRVPVLIASMPWLRAKLTRKPPANTI